MIKRKHRGYPKFKEALKGYIEKRNAFFESIWSKRPHKCVSCNKYLGKEPLSYMFDHLLEKSKYPELEFEEMNIAIVCLECHDNKTRGFPSKILQDLIKKVREKFAF